MNRSLLKTASVLAISLFAFPVLAQNVAPQNYAANIDPYGYGNVAVPLPQPMVMPSYQSQQAAGSYVPLSNYSSQYAAPAALYAGQSSPHPVTSAQYGVMPNYLPENRAQNNAAYNTRVVSLPQASSVGYAVQSGATQQVAVQQQAPQVVPYGTPYGAQPYAQPAYGAVQQAPVAYGAAPQSAAGQQYATTTVNAYPAPQVSVTAPQVSVQTPSSYGAGNTAVQSSITTAQNYEGAPAYQPLSNYQGTQQAYAPQAAPQQQAYIGQTYPTQDASQQAYAPQAQAQYTYGAQPQTYQPQTYTTTQIYTPSPALTVQQTADANSQAYAPTPSTAPQEANVSFATDPSVGPWYFSLRSGLTLQQDTNFRSAGSDVINSYETGWQLGTGVGYEFKSWNNWLAPRLELELTYDQQLVDTQDTQGVKSTDPSAYGFQRNLDLMANGFLDFRLNRYLAPYVGGGIGVGYADFDRYGSSAGGVIMDDNDVGFVWQAMGGLGINLSSASMIDFGYRYQQNTGVNLKAEDGTTNATTATDVGKHILMIGFRNNF